MAKSGGFNPFGAGFAGVDNSVFEEMLKDAFEWKGAARPLPADHRANAQWVLAHRAVDRRTDELIRRLCERLRIDEATCIDRIRRLAV